jgi:hypothetical protein
VPNGQDQGQTSTPGFVQKKMPDGSVRYYPDDLTNGQIRQQSQTTLQHVASALEVNSPEQQKIKQTAWDWLWKPKVSPEAASNFWAHVVSGESVGKLSQQESKNPSSVNLPRTVKLGSELAGDITSGLTSPGQIGMTLASLGDWTLDKVGGEAAIGAAKYLRPLLRVPGWTATAYFGLQGLGAAIGDRQPGETDDQVLERRILGAAAALGSAHAAGSAAFTGMTRSLVRSWGLTPDLADRVAARVAQLEKINSDRDLSLASIDRERTAKLDALDASTRRQIASVENDLEQQQREISIAAGARGANFDQLVDAAVKDSQGRLSDLQRERLHTGSRLVAETVQALREMEGDRDIEGSVKRPFREIGDSIKKPVASQEQIYQLIEAKLKDRGIQPTELPAAATKALGKREAATGEQVEGLDMSRFMDEVQAEGPEVSFNGLTRIREDLWQASESAKDANVAAALKEASESVSDMQEKAADEAGLGGKYRKAKADYLTFKRGLGSGFIRDWLAADDARSQDMLAKVSKLIQDDDETSGGQTSRAIRNVLKAAGVDVKPLDELTRQIAEEEQVPKRVKATGEALKGQSEEEARRARQEAVRARNEARKQISGAPREGIPGSAPAIRRALEDFYAEKDRLVAQEAKDKAREAEAEPIISRYPSKMLQGKSLQELYRLKMQEVARRNGNVPVSAYVMIAYGLLHTSPFMLLYGGGRMSIPAMMKNPAFQDWAIENAGLKVGTPEANRFRSGLAKMGPFLQAAAKRLERSGIPQGALILGERNRKPEAEPPTRDQVLQPQP